MIIRAAQAKDVAAIGNLWMELAEHHRQLDTRLPIPATDGAQRYAARIEGSLDDSHTKVFVAEDNGQIVGYVMGVMVDLLPEMFVEEKAGFLADIYVIPAQRGKGTGKALVAALKNWFRARDIEHFEWYVASANQAAVAFWRAMGGSEVILRMRASTQENE